MKTRYLVGAGATVCTITLSFVLLSNQPYEPAIGYSFDTGIDSIEDASGLLSTSEIASLDEIYSAIDDSREAHAQSTASSSAGTGATDTSWAAYPEEILSCTRSGNDPLVLVNKKYKLPATYAPTDLVPIGDSGIRATRTGMYIRNIIVSDLASLIEDATAQKIDLAALSAYRSYETQQSTYTYWVNYNGGDTAAADTISARPGHSQHQLGTTVDFTTNEISDQLGQHFANTAAGIWLARHAWEYGFALAYPAGWESTTGYSYEPWHFRYIGVENAAEWHSSGLILEAWLEEKN